MKNHTKNLLCGFTLIECLISILILSILITVSIPSYSSYLSSSKVNDVQLEIYTSLMQIRTQAITQSNTVVLCSSENKEHCDAVESWSHGWIAFVDLNNNKKRDKTTEDIILSYGNKHDLDIKWNRGRYLSYNYQGEINQNGSFFICDHFKEYGNSRSVIINKAGRAYRSKFTSNSLEITC